MEKEQFEETLDNLEELRSIRSELEKEIKSKQFLLHMVKEEQVRRSKLIISESYDVKLLNHRMKACENNFNQSKEDFEKLLEKMLEDKPITVDDVFSVSYGREAHFSVPANAARHNFVLDVSDPEKLDSDNFDEAQSGRFILYIDSCEIFSHNYEKLAMSYDFEDIKKAYKIFLKEGLVK